MKRVEFGLLLLAALLLTLGASSCQFDVEQGCVDAGDCRLGRECVEGICVSTDRAGGDENASANNVVNNDNNVVNNGSLNNIENNEFPNNIENNDFPNNVENNESTNNVFCEDRMPVVVDGVEGCYEFCERGDEGSDSCDDGEVCKESDSGILVCLESWACGDFIGEGDPEGRSCSWSWSCDEAGGRYATECKVTDEGSTICICEGPSQAFETELSRPNICGLEDPTSFFNQLCNWRIFPG